VARSLTEPVLGTGHIATGLSAGDRRRSGGGSGPPYCNGRAWFEARRGIAGRRRDSHDARAVDLLAAAPVNSAATLAAMLGIATKNAMRILDGLVAAEIAIEVSHR
jgi:hypothetical protein